MLWLRSSNGNSNNKSNEIESINRIRISVDKDAAFSNTMNFNVVLTPHRNQRYSLLN